MSSFINDYDDSLKIYLDDILKYPLMSEEEEKKYGKDLKLVNDLTIINFIDGDYYLDIKKLFVYLSYFENKYDILNDLKKFLFENEDKDNYLLCKKYLTIANKLNRSLNDLELKKYFNISSDVNLESLNDINMVREINNYKKYFNAKQIFIKSNLRLVIKIIGKFNVNKSSDFLDLVSEGNIGLIKAVNKFDVDLGYKFSTYAYTWISETINRFIYNNIPILYTSEGFKLKLKKFNSTVNELIEKNGRSYSAKELAELLDMSYVDVINYLNYSGDYVSLQQPVGNDNDTLLENTISDNYDFVSDIEHSFLTDDIKFLLSFLSEYEQKVIKLLYGLDDGVCHTYSEISRILHINVNRVNKYKIKAFQKIQFLTDRYEKISDMKFYLKKK